MAVVSYSETACLTCQHTQVVFSTVLPGRQRDRPRLAPEARNQFGCFVFLGIKVGSGVL